MTRVKLEHSNVTLMAHDLSVCKGRSCPLHNRTDHHMRHFKQVWREEGFVERLCLCGVGHPDPDQFEYWESIDILDVMSVHGCCGCCRKKEA